MNVLAAVLGAVIEIFAIQGSGASSPLSGTAVETRGVVTLLGPQGLFIQTPDARADADPATSNGVYVFLGGAPPRTIATGDEVTVTGTVSEFFGMTQIGGSPTVTRTGTAPLPATTTIAPGFTQFERLEGMLVSVDGVAAGGTDQFGGVDLVAGTERPFAAFGLSDAIFEVETDAIAPPAKAIVGGATIHARGALAYAFGEYEIWPAELTFTNPAYPRPVRARREGEVTIGTQNLLRLDNNDTSRLTGIANYIRDVLREPDVLAVQEVESITILQSLASRLNYGAYLMEGNDPGGIDVGFLVKQTFTVDSVTQLGKNDTWTPPNTTTAELLHDRPPLVLRGSFGNLPMTIIAVHPRSLIDASTLRVRSKRHEQALRISKYIQSLQTSEPQRHIVVAGDFNATEYSDGYADILGQITGNLDKRSALTPATDEVNPDLTNHVWDVPQSDRYSYVFEGNAEVLDHILTSLSLFRYVRDFQFARANADAADSMNPISDHDGAVLFLSPDPLELRRRATRH